MSVVLRVALRPKEGSLRFAASEEGLGSWVAIIMIILMNLIITITHIYIYIERERER